MDKAALEELLAGVERNAASSLNLVVGRPPFLRLRDKMVACEGEPIADAGMRELIGEFVFRDQQDRLDAGEEVELLYNSGRGARFRTVLMRTADGLAAVFTRVPNEAPKFEDLGLPAHVASFVSFRSGVVLLNGFLGSGKSTTLSALVDCLNRSTPRHVICIEDGIEFVHRPICALVHQREVGSHVSDHARGIRDAVKQSADVVVVSELRNFETLLAILDAAERGCLVLTTMHASSVAGGFEAIAGLCPPDVTRQIMRRLAAVLRVTMSQVLLERRHHQGRVPLVEILINSQTVRGLIAERQFQDLPRVMERGRGLGMQTVDLGLTGLLERNLISMDEALYHAVDRDAIYARV